MPGKAPMTQQQAGLKQMMAAGMISTHLTVKHTSSNQGLPKAGQRGRQLTRELKLKGASDLDTCYFLAFNQSRIIAGGFNPCNWPWSLWILTGPGLMMSSIEVDFFCRESHAYPTRFPSRVLQDRRMAKFKETEINNKHSLL